jgi:hypothetical protein
VIYFESMDYCSHFSRVLAVSKRVSHCVCVALQYRGTSCIQAWEKAAQKACQERIRGAVEVSKKFEVHQGRQEISPFEREIRNERLEN